MGEVPPVAHLCQFYKTKEDIADILVPYFKAGLENNELCLWVTAAPLEAAEAFEVLKLVLPDLDRYLSTGQMRIIPYTECYSENGSRGPRDLLRGLAPTISNGFNGIRLADQAALLASENMGPLDAAEANYGPGKSPVLALCVYPLDGCDSADVVNAIRNHQITLIKQNGRWESLGKTDNRLVTGSAKSPQTDTRYQELFNNTLEAMEVIDAASGRIVLANPAAARMFGFNSPDDMIGVDPLDYIPPEDRERTGSMIAEYMFEKDLHKVLDVRVLAKDGRQLWVSAMGARTEYRGKLAGLVSMRDITAQKDAEKAFQESQEQLMAIFDGVKDGIALLDLEGRVVLVNKRILEVGGYAEQEIVDKRFDDLPMLNVQAMPDMLKAEKTIQSGQGETSFELEAVVKTGERLCLEVRVNPLKYGENLVGGIAVLRDITARRKAEELLRNSERQYRLLAAHVLDVIWTMDFNLKFTYVTPSVTHLLGYSVEETMQSSLDRFVVPESLEVILATIEKALVSHKSGEMDQPPEKLMDVAVVRKDGSTVWTETRATLTFDSSGIPSGVLGVTRDINERRKAQESLRLSEEKNRLLVENSHEVIAVIQEGNFVFVNSKAEELSGYRPEELISKPVVDFVHPEDRELMADYHMQRLEGQNAPLSYAFRLIDKQGNTKWVEVNAVLFNWEGRPAVLSFLADITQRKQAEMALRVSEERNRLLVENATEGIAVVQDGKIVFVNRALLQMVTYSEEEILSGTFDQFVHPEDREMVVDRYEKRIDGQEVPSTYPFRVIDKDGSTKWAEINSVTFDWEGRPAILGLISDITDRKRAEEALQASEERFRKIYEKSPVGIVVYDSQGKITGMNKSALEIFGLAQTGQSRSYVLLEEPLLPVEARERLQAKKSLAWEGTFDFDKAKENGAYGKMTRSGLAHLHVTLTPMASRGEGPSEGYLLQVQDISQRKNMEDALRENEKRYRLLAENVSDVIWVTDLDMKLKYISPSITKLVGYSSEEVISRTIEESMPPSSLETVMQKRKGLGSMESPRNAQSTDNTLANLELKCKDGSTIWVETTYSLIYGADGQPAEIMGVIRDITERKKAEAALRLSEEKYRSLVENVGDVVCGLDDQGCFTYISPSIQQLSNYTTDEIIGRPLSDFIHADDLSTVHRVCEEAKKGKPGMAEFRWLDKGGALHRMRSSHNLASRDGEAIALAVVMRDVTEQKQAEEALRESEKRYRLLAENISDVIWVVDLEIRPVFFTPSIFGLLGYTVEEIMSKRVEDIVLPNSLQVARDHLALCLANQTKEDSQVETLELQMKRNDGAVIWVESTHGLVWDEDGHPTEVMGVMRDISKRKQAEELFQALSVSSPTGIYIVSDRRFEFVNPELQSYLGYADNEILGKESLDFVFDEDKEQAKAKAVQMLKGERTSPYEYRIVTKNGKIKWVMETVTSIQYRGKRSVLGNLMDATHRKEAEQALKESEERFRDLVETTSDLVWEVDENGRYSYVSPRIEQILGYRPDEIVGKTPFDLMPFKEANRVAKTFAQAITSKQAIKFLENTNLHKNGDSVVLESNGVPFFDEKGEIRGYRGIDRDITERKRAEEQLQQSFQKLEKTLDGVIMAITSMVETRDRYTAGHQRRVTRLACAIAEEMGLSEDQIQMIRMAGLLHDLGKLFIPTEILCKPGQLTEIETAIIKTHPQAGYDILKNIEFPWPIAQIVAQHHERLDGSGYPLGLSGEEIHPEARILAVSDVVEAMSSHRPYRPALGLDKALREIVHNKGTFYDPDVVDACVRLFVDRKFRLDEEMVPLGNPLT